jgi:phosphatidylserine/phosphatidylglycerophosphate/cardiolipin synthase-like enzyme
VKQWEGLLGSGGEGWQEVAGRNVVSLLTFRIEHNGHSPKTGGGQMTMGTSMKFRISLLTSFLLALALPLIAFAGGEQVLQAFGALPAVEGTQQTKVRLLTDNMNAWYARWYMIEQAQSTIDATYFIVEDDIFGKSLLGLLMKKAEQGVKVRLLVDARGSKSLSKRVFSQAFLQALAARDNAEVRVFNPYFKALHKVASNVRNLIASNHDKIILVDKDWAITGGRNIGANYFADPADNAHGYRDTDVLMQGGIVAKQMQEAFDEEFNATQNYEVSDGWFPNWHNKKREIDVARRIMRRWISGRGAWDPGKLDGDMEDIVSDLNEEMTQYSKLTSYAVFEHDPWQGRRAYPVKVLDKNSYRGDKNSITSHMIELMDAAEDYILIQNPYVVITGEVMEALKRADARGVKVTIHTNSPASSDSLITQAFFIRDWWKLLRDLKHIRIQVFHKARKLHAKTFVIDDKVTSVGTYNMDPMSQGINGEVMAVIESRSFATRSRLRIEKDIAESVEYLIKKDSQGNAELDAKGKVQVLSGPEQHLKGATGGLIKILSNFSFLRPLI